MMQSDRNKPVRLYVAGELGAGLGVELSAEQAHYLRDVMRLGPAAGVLAFNNVAGEWRTTLDVDASNRTARLQCVEQTRPPETLCDLWLMFAPLKRARTDLLAEKASELGCSRLQPVFTERTNSRRVQLSRLRAHAVEAAEQCDRCAVPEVEEPVELARLLAGWPADRRLLFCDERRAAEPARTVLCTHAPEQPWAILIGPEGGFTPQEAERIMACPAAVPVSLGPRVLRADTAAVAALAIWQSVLGDWRGSCNDAV